MDLPVADGGTHSYKVGEITVTVIHDGILAMPRPPGFIRGVPDDEVGDALAAAGWPADKLITSFAPVLLRDGTGTTLVDTGFGPDQGAKEGATNGKLVGNMKAAGIDPAEVDSVVISHFHGDHVNGLVSAAGPVYPNARILVPEAEWDYWMSDDERANAPAGRLADLFANNRRIFDPLRNRVERFSPGDKVVPGLVAEGTPGHTRGHTSFWLRSGGEETFLQIDLTNHAPLGMPHPDWNSMFDQFPDEAQASRRRMYDRLAESGVPVQAFHHPFPGRNRIVRDGEGFRLEPVV